MTNTEIIKKLEDIYLDLQIQFNWEIDCIPEIVISNRLRSLNGRIEWRRNWSRKIVYCRIIMSKAVLDEFGWERFEKTFRHEVAHLANLVIYGGENHDFNFKRLCRDFGGSMNSSIAGYSFADCASKEYVRPIAKYIYKCGGCGVEKKMSKRMSSKKRGSSFYHCCRCGTPLSKWTETFVK